ncbi:DsbA family oxidoreductase [Salinimicrobium sp. HB62]|uniref:DsbA family oxidoreductase n=1 Tax=Salinimicrobium sp. HB62 TaxID=3077781 RepID=UPI002D77AB6A|nr:DsbA family oxidoreductase [Salinimicrobium sp. HB62]
MEIKIWSDVRCPFCYIGKRKLEAALEQFPQKDKVRISWKSFQLDPSLETRTDMNVIDYFVETKGVTAEQARQMLSGATQMAGEVGLNFDLEKGVLANSFKAHRLIQMAKTQELGDEIEEALFKAHFEEAKNIDDTAVLISVAASIGMKEAEVREILNSDAFAYEVKQDELEARNIGVRGVPFFVFDDRYAVSGAQPVEVFLQTLEETISN